MKTENQIKKRICYLKELLEEHPIYYKYFSAYERTVITTEIKHLEWVLE